MELDNAINKVAYAPFPGLVADALKGNGYQLLNKAWKRTSLLGNEVDNPIHLDGMYLGDYTTINLRATKRIVKADIIGSKRGTVKEIIATNDYDISIAGRAESADLHRYPSAIVVQLGEIWQKQEAVKIECPVILQHFDFDRVVIEDMSLNESEGESGVQEFQLQCTSDGNDEDELTMIIA